MAIVNTIQRLMNGYGNGTCYVGTVGTALSTTSAQATTITLANSGFTQGYTNGLIRVHIYNGGGTTPAVVVQVSVSDGTSTVVICPTTNSSALSATVAGSGLDLLIDVNTDIQIATVTITTTLTGTTPTGSMDSEICLNP